MQEVSKKLFRSLRLDILVAIFLRLLIMPFFAHEDLFLTYRRSLNIVLGQRGWLADMSAIPHIIQALYLHLIKVFADLEFLLPIQEHITAIPNINSLTFLFKLPYLVAEILFWTLLFKNFRIDNFTRKLALFNPIIIYAVYMFGRYESFVLLLIVLLLIAIKKSDLFTQGLSFVSLLLTRASLILVTPAFLANKLKKQQLFKLLFVFTVLTAAGFFIIPTHTMLGFINWVLTGQHSSYLLQAKLNLGFGSELYLLPVIGTLVYLTSFRILSKHGQKLPTYLKFSVLSFVILACYYSLSLFHPQYIVWILPFWLLLLTAFNSPIFRKVSLLAHLLFFLILFYWEGKTTLGLLLPVSNIFWFAQMNGEVWMLISNIAKSLFSGTLFFVVYYVLSSIQHNSRENEIA